MYQVSFGKFIPRKGLTRRREIFGVAHMMREKIPTYGRRQAVFCATFARQAAYDQSLHYAYISVEIIKWNQLHGILPWKYQLYIGGTHLMRPSSSTARNSTVAPFPLVGGRGARVPPHPRSHRSSFRFHGKPSALPPVSWIMSTCKNGKGCRLFFSVCMSTHPTSSSLVSSCSFFPSPSFEGGKEKKFSFEDFSPL